MNNLCLRNGTSIPAIGLGTWQITDREKLISIIEEAVHIGYLHFDTAASYGNEISLGKALKGITIKRENYIVADKLWNSCRGYEEAQEACKNSLRKLKIDYLDIYMIHWPASMRLYDNWKEINAETWRAMETLYREGYVNAIGVSNFNIHHLQALKETANEMPMINQIEFHPGMHSEELLSYCRDNNILVEASSPLGNGKILQNELLLHIAEKYNKTSAQICLRWALDKGIAVLPKSIRIDRIRSNYQIFDFKLEGQDSAKIDGMQYCGGIGIDSDEVVEFG